MSEKRITKIEEIKKQLCSRRSDAHKGDFGKVLIFAGSRRYTGAAYLCAQAAVRCGSGLVTLTTDPQIIDILAIKLNEAMVINNDEPELNELAHTADVIAIGCGMGRHKNTLKAVEYVLNLKRKIPIVIDADAINVLAGKLEKIQGRSDLLLTPHEGEFARLLNISREEVSKYREEYALRFVQVYGVNLLLKGKDTIIAGPNGYRINPTGSAKMASGGMGDILTGMIASLVGQGMELYTAGYVAAFLHGYAADEKGRDMYSVTATDVMEYLPYVLNKIKEHTA